MVRSGPTALRFVLVSVAFPLFNISIQFKKIAKYIPVVIKRLSFKVFMYNTNTTAPSIRGFSHCDIRDHFIVLALVFKTGRKNRTTETAWVAFVRPSLKRLVRGHPTPTRITNWNVCLFSKNKPFFIRWHMACYSILTGMNRQTKHPYEKRRHAKVKIAITIWGNRISPVFDSATTLMIAQVENLKITDRCFEKFNPKLTNQTLSRLENFQVDALICGAITDVQAKAIEQGGIKLISFIAGNAEEALVSLFKTPHRMSDFLMPGGTSDRIITLEG